MHAEQTSPKQETYQIIVSGHLDIKWKDWFDGFSIAHQASNETCMFGSVADQAALHGMLAKIRDLGLSLSSVRRVEHEMEQSGSYRETKG